MRSSRTITNLNENGAAMTVFLVSAAQLAVKDSSTKRSTTSQVDQIL